MVCFLLHIFSFTLFVYTNSNSVDNDVDKRENVDKNMFLTLKYRHRNELKPETSEGD